MTEMVLGIRLTADGKGLVGEVRLSREEIEKLTKATKEAGGATRAATEDGERYEKSLEGVGSAARMAGYAIVAVAGALALKVKGVIDTSTELARMNVQTGRSVEWLGRMKYVADQSDVSFQTLLQTYQRLPRAIVEAFGENSESGRALRAIGIDPAKLKDTDQAMLLIADRFRQVRDPAVQAALAEMIFKQRGEELIPFLRQGADGIRRLYEESGRYSHITGEAVGQAKLFKQQLVDLQYGSGQLVQSIANELVPWLARVVGELNAANKAGGGLKLWMQTATGDVGAKLTENNAKLEELRRLRADLSKDTFANRANEAIFGDVGTLDRQIAFFEKQNQMLLLVQQQQALAGAGPAYRDEGARFTPRAPGIKVSLEDLARDKKEPQGKHELTFDELMERAAMTRLKAQDEREQGAEREAQAVEKLARSYKDLIDPIEPLRRQLTEIETLYTSGKLTADEYAAATFNIQNKMEDLFNKSKPVKDDLAELKFAIEGWGRDLSKELAHMAVSGEMSFKRLGDSARAFVEQLVAIQIQRRIMEPMLKGATSAIGAYFGSGGGAGTDASGAAMNANLAHSGGIVGALAGRTIHPAYFENAPRLHGGGIAGDEVPVIARRGEGVFTPQQMRAMGPQSVRVEIVNSGTEKEVESATPRIDVDGMVVRVVQRDVQVNGPISQTLSRTFGMQRRMG